MDAAKDRGPFRYAENMHCYEAKTPQGGIKMYRLLVKLMVIAAFAEFGMNVDVLKNCHSRQCVVMFQKRALDVLKIDWKPISVFPAEAKRFR